jgi:hypothetical protein
VPLVAFLVLILAILSHRVTVRRPEGRFGLPLVRARLGRLPSHGRHEPPGASPRALRAVGERLDVANIEEWRGPASHELHEMTMTASTDL